MTHPADHFKQASTGWERQMLRERSPRPKGGPKPAFTTLLQLSPLLSLAFEDIGSNLVTIIPPACPSLCLLSFPFLLHLSVPFRCIEKHHLACSGAPICPRF